MVLMYRKNLTEKNNARDRTRSSVGRPSALSKASGGDVRPWRVKARLGAAAAQYNTSGAVDEATLNSITTEQISKNMGTCNTPSCDSCWHM